MNDHEHIEQALLTISAHVHGVCDQLVRLNENVEALLRLLEHPRDTPTEP